MLTACLMSPSATSWLVRRSTHRCHLQLATLELHHCDFIGLPSHSHFIMSINIRSASEWQTLLSGTSVVVADCTVAPHPDRIKIAKRFRTVYADWCGPCKMIAPHFERLAKENAIDKKVAFAKVNVDSQSTIAKTNGVSAMPTFKIFHNGTCVETVKGANPSDLGDAVGKATKLAFTSGGQSGNGFKTPGRTLGNGPAQGGSGFDVGKILNIVIMFVGMYLVSFFAASNKKGS